MLDEFKAHSASVKTVDVKTDEPGESLLCALESWQCYKIQVHLKIRLH